MVPTGGTFFILLILACNSLGKPTNAGDRPDKPPPGFKNTARKLMMDCVKKGYRPSLSLAPLSIMPDSEQSDRDGRPEPASYPSYYQSLLSSVYAQDSAPRFPMIDPSQMEVVSQMRNITIFVSNVKKIQNNTDPSACFLRAFVAPMCFKVVMMKGETLDLNDYDTMLQCAKPMLMRMPARKMSLPRSISMERMERMMNVLREVCEDMSQDHKVQVVRWVREQIAQNQFNCTLRGKSKPGNQRPDQKPNGRPPKPNGILGMYQDMEPMEACPPDLKWMTPVALRMLGPCVLQVSLRDIDAVDNNTVCQYFKSDGFRNGFGGVTKIKPFMGRTLLRKFSNCFSGWGTLSKYVDRLGVLACYFNSADNPLPDNGSVAKKLLTQLQKCKNPESRKLKKDLIRKVITEGDVSDKVLKEIGSNLNLMSAEQLRNLPKEAIKNFLKAQHAKRSIRWSLRQQRELVKTQLGEKCTNVTARDLADLQSAVGGARRCVFQSIKAKGILDNEERLRNMSLFMKKWQVKALLRKAKESLKPSELVKRMNGRLLQSLSLDSVANANISSVSEAEGKDWSRAQALLLANKLNVIKTKFRKLRSIIQGVTCRMISKVFNKDSMEFAQALTDWPQWLSKMQTKCLAWKLFSSLEEKRANYFETISDQELEEIPGTLLFFLHPSKVERLPDTVCDTLLMKLSDANLTLVPCRARARSALLQRALLCQSEGGNMSSLSSDQLTSMGPLLCDIRLSQLRSLSSDVRMEVFSALSNCPPKSLVFQNQQELKEIIKETYGDPGNFSPETVSTLGQSLFSSGVVNDLPNTPDMKESVASLLESQSEVSDTTQRKLFNLVTASPTAQRRRRDSHGSMAIPTEYQITELGGHNNIWTAGQLEAMKAETFSNTLEVLGRVRNFSQEQRAKLREKAIEAFGAVANMKESHVLDMGCINAAFYDQELEQLPFKLDDMNAIGQCVWNPSQLRAVWKGLAKREGLTAQSLGDDEMISLDRFLCGLSEEEIDGLDKEAFREAADSIGELECSVPTMERLKNLYVSVYGKPSSWKPAYITNMGNIIAGLKKEELKSLSPSMFGFIKPSSMKLITPENFASLSADQLKSLDPDAAAMVTVEQRAALTPEMRAALEDAETGGAEELVLQKGEGSGAPSLSVEGLSAFIRPVLFLVMGFLLL